jgi:hypothetical protein
MNQFDVWIRKQLDELNAAKLEAAGMPVQSDDPADAASRELERLTTIVRVTAQSEAMARAQVAAVLGTTGEELRAYPAPV